MDILQMGSITGVSSAAAKKVASALAPTTTQTTDVTAKPKASTSSSASTTTSSTTTSSTTITANDFLTLLVSELKNQDPTQPTDPTSYITQMVGVNSLQQLIQINQGVSSLGGTSTSTSTSSS